MLPHEPSRPIVLATVGTDGDIYPFLNLGRTLRARGHRVTLASHEHFRGAATESGLGFCPLVTSEETEALLTQEGMWHPLRGPLILGKWGARLMHRQYCLLRELVEEPGTFLVASPGVVAARVVQETSPVRLASMVLQPWLIPSTHAPAAIMGGLTLPRWAPHWAGRAYYRLFDGVGSILLGRELERLRAPMQLPPIRRVFRWWFSPALVIGLFPDWFGPPQPDWPPQMKLAGFPRHNGHAPGPLSQEVEAFFGSGAPPVVFTFGTGMKHAASLFSRCLEACRQAGIRGIFVTRYQDQLPSPLPPFALPCAFAPFAGLFPRCAAVVHHGGVGTTAAALAAGRPQLILPFAFDQLDNAHRVHRLGMGTWIDRRRQSGEEIAKVLRWLTADFSPEPVRSVVERCRSVDGIERAAEILEDRW